MHMDMEGHSKNGKNWDNAIIIIVLSQFTIHFIKVGSQEVASQVLHIRWG